MSRLEDDNELAAASNHNLEQAPSFSNTSISTRRKKQNKPLFTLDPTNVSTTRGVVANEDEMSYRTNDLPQISRHLSETPNNEGRQNYEDIVSCMVCYDTFDSVNHLKLPKILPCQHTYCVECIKNLVHCSNSERGRFECPQCKFPVENLKDVTELPTNRIVLSLLEKESLNFQGYASCPACRQIRNLEVCFECNLPLCVQCITKHYDTWKNEMNRKLLEGEQRLEVCKQNIDQIGPQITNNFDNIDAVKKDIEDAYNSMLTRLRNEKEQLLKTISDVKDENAKYVNLKKDIVGLISNFKTFREANENFDKKAMMSRVKKSQMYLEHVPKLEKEYNNVISSNFRTLERFEKRPLPDSDYNFTGNLVISRVNLAQAGTQLLREISSRSSLTSSGSSSSTVNKLEPIREQSRNAKSVAPVRPPPVAGSNIQVANNGDALSRWMMLSQAKPQSEVTLASVPLFLAAYGNFLFSVDQTSYLSIYEKVFSVELKLKNSVKLNMPGIKSIALNTRYLAVAYAGLKKDQLKGALKNMSSSGIVLYGRNEHVVCSIYEKLIDLNNNGKESSSSSSFRSLSSIALTESTVLVGDREARAIYEMDLATGTLMRTLNIDGQPVSLSLNSQFLVCVDAQNSLVYVFERASLGLVVMSSAPVKGGIEQALITEDNLIFVRAADSGQVTLLDGSLEHRATFNEIQARVTNMALIRDQNCLLAIGGINNRQQFKIFGYMA